MFWEGGPPKIMTGFRGGSCENRTMFEGGSCKIMTPFLNNEGGGGHKFFRPAAGVFQSVLTTLFYFHNFCSARATIFSLKTKCIFYKIMFSYQVFCTIFFKHFVAYDYS